jgi:hypothetical protein
MPDRQPPGWSELQAELPTILGRLQDDQPLARAAAANPIYALEELGYEVDPAQRQEIEDRLRFRPRVATRLRQLRRRIFKEVGGEFDLRSPDDVRAALETVGATPGQTKAPRLQIQDYGPPRPRVAWAEPDEDRLEQLRGSHAVLEPLLEYRHLEASEPRLAPRWLYDEIRSGERQTPLVHIRGVLKARRR